MQNSHSSEYLFSFNRSIMLNLMQQKVYGIFNFRRRLFIQQQLAIFKQPHFFILAPSRFVNLQFSRALKT
jgi:hypothetical protein